MQPPSTSFPPFKRLGQCEAVSRDGLPREKPLDHMPIAGTGSNVPVPGIRRIWYRSQIRTGILGFQGLAVILELDLLNDEFYKEASPSIVKPDISLCRYR